MQFRVDKAEWEHLNAEYGFLDSGEEHMPVDGYDSEDDIIESLEGQRGKGNDIENDDDDLYMWIITPCT
jgi:hypothetical protein